MKTQILYFIISFYFLNHLKAKINMLVFLKATAQQIIAQFLKHQMVVDTLYLPNQKKKFTLINETSISNN
jgi:hypothetical protein